MSEPDLTAAKAVLYLRVSTKEQAQRGGEAEGYSIPAQREACRRKANELGAIVVDEFADLGESARSANRPRLQAMLAYLKENAVEYVIVHKVDRLARDRADDALINMAIRSAGATLVSCSENIDETPSGMFMHGILSVMAEFYSRNLAAEVIKGSTEKAKNGGTIGKAPLGYRNVRRIVDGREVRTVELDPERAPLIKWAFETYATGAWSITRLLHELTRRGLECVPTAKAPAQPLQRSHLHKLLKHPYYKGVVRYRGVEYEGRHERLVSDEVWQRVQDVLAAHNQAGEKQRIHHHYLKGSVFCGQCGSRLIITNARSRLGKIYPYFVCAGRHQKRTNCTFKAVLIETVERKVEAHYDSHHLTPEERDALEAMLTDEFSTFEKQAAAERRHLKRRRQRLLAERSKLLQAHYAGAIDLDLLTSEQTRLREQLAQISQRLTATEQNHALIDRYLKRTVDLVADAQGTYLSAPKSVRRQLNQALFTRIWVEERGEIKSDLAEPFKTLLSPQVKTLLSQDKHRPAETTSTEPDWQAWEESFNDETHKENPVGFETTGRPQRGRGLTYELLVGAGGFEPP